jgi:hypothetical protein
MRRALLVSVAALTGWISATAQQFDPTTVTILGGGISAGFADFHLVETNQVTSWPALIAGPMGTVISIPTYRDDGQAGVVNSFQLLPGLLPVVAQGGERELPFPIFSLNASVPFLRVADSLRVQPQPQYDGSKLIASLEHNLLGTFVNGILGGPLLSLPTPVLLSQANYAAMLSPTAVFVELGFHDALDAALAGDASRATPINSFTTDYTTLLHGLLATQATVIVMTVPDPTDTAYFSTVADAAAAQGVEAAGLAKRLNLNSGDLLTLSGLVESGDILRGRRTAPLSPDAVLPAATAAAIQSMVLQYNNAIRSAAGKNAAVFDLAAYLHQIRGGGATVAGVPVKGTFAGGFYSRDGLFPNATGHALIANAVLQFVNTTYGTKFAPVAVPAPANAGITQEPVSTSDAAPDWRIR